MSHGLFIGLITLDLIYLADLPPQNNQKLVADDYTVAAGGPATNAAIAFSHLGNQASILGILGSHPMTQLIHSDFGKYQINLIDLEPTSQNSPPVSSIIVTKNTGERAVISINAVKTQATAKIPNNILSQVGLEDTHSISVSPVQLGQRSGRTPNLHDTNIVLIDGHQIEAGYQIAQIAKAKNIPVVIDGGSWKPGFEKILPFVDYAICSANFYPPNCRTTKDTFTYLKQMGIPHIAITHGEKPIEYVIATSQYQESTIDVTSIRAVDTLGAGDIFHGAFCHYINSNNFAISLAESAKIAGYSCQYFGTRRWMEPVR
jgi:sugar/nucleoside kinase (ribokinase family)